MNAEQYKGRKVKIVGMLAKENPQIEHVLGVRRLILFRLAINCCAANAVPLALVLENGDTGMLNDDDWLEASGTIKIREQGEFALLVMENVTVTPTKQPAQPFLTMVWGIF